MSDIDNAIGKAGSLCETTYAGKDCTVNLSLGGWGCPDISNQRGMLAAVRAGVTVVVAAGNDDSDSSGFNPACYGGYYIPNHSPISYDENEMKGGIIAVGATNASVQRTWFSNYGDRVQVFAPGQGIWSAAHYSEDGLVEMMGTSMACPHVVGLFSLCVQERRDTNPSESQQARHEHCYDRVIDCETDNVISVPGTTELQPLVRRYAQGNFNHGAGTCKNCRASGPTAPPSPTPEPTLAPTDAPTTAPPTLSPTTAAPTVSPTPSPTDPPTNCDSPGNNDDFTDNVRTCCEFTVNSAGDLLTADGTLEVGEDRDACALDLDPETDYVCTLTDYEGTNGSFDTILALYDNNDVKSAENDDCGAACTHRLHSRLAFGNKSGKHYLQARSWGGRSAGRWKIECAATKPEPVGPCDGLQFVITADRYSGETSWEVSVGNTLTCEGELGTVGEGQDVPFCCEIPADGTASSQPIFLKMLDSYGDGNCCAYGEGKTTYSLYGGPVQTMAQFTSTTGSVPGREMIEQVNAGDDTTTSPPTSTSPPATTSTSPPATTTSAPPTPNPTPSPTTGMPTSSPTSSPTTAQPTSQPTAHPTAHPTLAPWTCSGVELTLYILPTTSTDIKDGTFVVLKDDQNNVVAQTDKLSISLPAVMDTSGASVGLGACFDDAEMNVDSCYTAGIYHRDESTNCDVNDCGSFQGTLEITYEDVPMASVPLDGNLPLVEQICPTE